MESRSKVTAKTIGPQASDARQPWNHWVFSFSCAGGSLSLITATVTLSFEYLALAYLTSSSTASFGLLMYRTWSMASLSSAISHN